MFANKNISLPAPLVPLSIYFRRCLCLCSPLLYHTSITRYAARNPTPPASRFLVSCPFLFSLSVRTLQLCILFPPPSLSQDSWIPTSRSRFLTCSAIPGLLRSSVANPHTFHARLLNYEQSFVLLSTLLLSIARSPSLLLLFSRLLALLPFPVLSFVWLLNATSFLPRPLWATHCFLPRLTSVYPRATS